MPPRRTLYLDHNATTPILPEVARALREHLVEAEGVAGAALGNPSSLHAPGRRARARLEGARERVAKALGVDPAELTFTSGGTESNNLFILGVEDPRQPLWISAVEHPSVREAARRRWALGAPGGELPVLADGRLDPALRDRGLDFSGALVSLQWVNNETGTIQELREWAEWFRSRGAIVHTDGAQGFFRLPAGPAELGVDAATITAHKSFGPAGVGALWVRRGIVLDPILRGGSQEKKLRPGTENLLAIVGFGALAERALAGPLWDLASLAERAAGFRGALRRIPGLTIVSPETGSFPACVAVAFDDLIAETLLVRLDLEGIAASSGSACSSGARQPSSVLAAMGVPDRAIRGALRFSFGPSTTAEELAFAADRLAAIAADLRAGATTRATAPLRGARSPGSDPEAPR